MAGLDKAKLRNFLFCIKDNTRFFEKCFDKIKSKTEIVEQKRLYIYSTFINLLIFFLPNYEFK